MAATQTGKELKYIREQTTHFQRELGHLRKELAFVKAKQDSAHAELVVVVDARVRELMGPLMASRDSSLEAPGIRIAEGLEREVQCQGGELEALRRLVQDLEANLASLVQEGRRADPRLEASSPSLALTSAQDFQAHQALVDERLCFLERAFGDSIDKHSKESEAWRAVHAHHASLSERVERIERNVDHSTDGLRAASVSLANRKAGWDADHASLQERVDYLENVLGGSAERHARELEALRSAHTKLASEAKVHHGKLLELSSKDIDGHHSSIEERLLHLESLMGDSADKHARELKAHQSSVRDLLTKEREARDSSHATLNERVDYLEGVLGDHATKHQVELDATRSAHSRLTNEAKAREAHQASLAERLEELEKAFGSSHAKIDQVYSRVTAVREAWKRSAALAEPREEALCFGPSAR